MNVGVSVSVEEVKNIVKELYLSGDRDSILLLGPPGVGKSTVVKQLARELAERLGKEFIEYDDLNADLILQNPENYFVLVDLRMTETEPTDLIGFPKVEDSAVIYKPLKWAVVLNKCPGILFLDEITSVLRPDVQSAMLKITLDRKVGFIPLHKDVLVIAAGNPPEYSSVAVNLPAPLVNRMSVYYIEPPALEEWKEFMDKEYGEDWDKRIFAFLKRFNYFIKVPASGDTLKQFPTPRGWTKLALVSHKIKSLEMLKAIATAKVGSEASAHLIAFLQHNVDIQQLINKPELFNKLEEDAKYMVGVMLSKLLEDVAMQWSKSKLEESRKVIHKLTPLVKQIFKSDREILVLSFTLVNIRYKPFLAQALMTVKELKEILEFLRKQLTLSHRVRDMVF